MPHGPSERASTEPDFRLLFESVPGLHLVLAPELTIVAVNDAYLRATKTERAAILGRPIFEVFPDNPDDPTATGVANLRASLERVLAGHETDVMAVQRYDIRRPDFEGGGFVERHVSPTNSPVFGADGQLAYIIHRVEDVTDLVRLRRGEGERDRAIRDLSVRSEERYRQLLDAAPDAMVVVDETGCIGFVNHQTVTLFGYTPEELVGQDVALLIPSRFRGGHAGHVRRYVTTPSSRTMGSGLELFGRHKDGDEIPIEVSLSPLRSDGKLTVSASIRDTRDRKRLEADARLTAQRLTSAVESVQDAFALFDARDHLVLCNSVYRNLLGDQLSGAVIGRSYEQLLDAWIATLQFANDSEREHFRSARLAQRHDPRAAFDVRTRDGRSLRVADRRTPEGGMVKTIWDLTDDVRREEQLWQARVAADSANAAKSEFLSSMSHELRTPLNAILGFAQLLQRDKKEALSERHQERVEQILKGGQHLLRLISDILDLSRIESGGLSLSTEPVHVAEVLDEVMVTLGPMAARAGIRLEKSDAVAMTTVVRVDRTRFAQILLNFGSNAIKYNRRDGSVAFRVTSPGEGRLRVTVVDTGFGVPLDKQDKLFLPFQRAGQETGPIEGTGIGLAISKRLAELMQGSVGFQSTPSQGSEFWVELPLHVARSEPRELSERDRGQPLPRDLRGSVLYIEDNPANVRFMQDVLEPFEGVKLVTAPTAELGVELARANPPSVVILDINLPGMSGLDALALLRSWPETRAVPVIALTAAASAQDRERGERLGFYRYLTKPVDVADLESTLENLIGVEHPFG